jgi:hypothetical protein
MSTLREVVSVDRFSRFSEQHGVSRAHVLHTQQGEIWYASTQEGRWAITWFPYRSDHPDAPELVTDSLREGIDGSGTEEDVSERLREYFESRDDRALVYVAIEREASPDEVAAVQRVFDEAGTPAVVSPSYGRYSVFHPDWLVIVEWSALAFASGLAAKAGGDTWDALRDFVTRLHRERRALGHEQGSVEIDEGSRQIFLHDALPREAYQALAQLPEEGTYHWDVKSGGWRKL